MSKVTDLRIVGAWWYARFTDGNFSMDGPTSFPASMDREAVLLAMAAKNPECELPEEQSPCA